MERKTILIVDDAPDNLTYLSALLKDAYQTKVATSGEKALRIAETAPMPDLSLLDISMPEMSGYEVCQRLKENEQTRTIPVIFLTAMSEAEDEEKGLELGAVDYITKPIRPPILRARVRTHLELKDARDALARLASTDKLTGISNRRRFDEVMPSEWARARRDKHAMSIAMIDIDYFKNFNDAHGHAAGDACLQSVAQAMQRSLRRASDLLARLGGEEFVAVLTNTDEAGLRRVMQNLLDEVAALGIAHGASAASPIVSISVGAVLVQPHALASFTEPLAAADALLYEAKAAGRDRCIYRVGGEPAHTLTVASKPSQREG